MLVTTTTSHADGLRIQGTTEYRFYNSTGERVITEHHNHFSLDVDRGGTYLLEFFSTVNTNGYSVTGFDGTNHYRIMYTSRHSKSPGSAELTEPRPFDQLNHAAQVWFGPYPMDLEPLERIVWLAMASGAYLADPGSRRMPAPWRSPREELLAYSFTNVVEQDSTWLGVPVKAEFYTCATPGAAEIPDLLVPNSQTSLAFREQEERKVRALKPGLLAARYSAQAFTNLTGTQVPLDCKLEVFWQGFGRNPTNVSPAELFTVSVTNISVIATHIRGEPKILGTLSVNDYRYKYQDPKHTLNQLRYRINGQVWRAMGDTKLQAAARAVKDNPRYANSRSRGVRKVTVAVLVAGMLLLPVVLMRMKKRS